MIRFCYWTIILLENQKKAWSISQCQGKVIGMLWYSNINDCDFCRRLCPWDGKESHHSSCNRQPSTLLQGSGTKCCCQSNRTTPHTRSHPCCLMPETSMRPGLATSPRSAAHACSPCIIATWAVATLGVRASFDMYDVILETFGSYQPQIVISAVSCAGWHACTQFTCSIPLSLLRKIICLRIWHVICRSQPC